MYSGLRPAFTSCLAVAWPLTPTFMAAACLPTCRARRQHQPVRLRTRLHHVSPRCFKAPSYVTEHHNKQSLVEPRSEKASRGLQWLCKASSDTRETMLASKRSTSALVCVHFWFHYEGVSGRLRGGSRCCAVFNCLFQCPRPSLCLLCRRRRTGRNEVFHFNIAPC